MCKYTVHPSGWLFVVCCWCATNVQDMYMARLSGFQWCVHLGYKESTWHSCQDFSCVYILCIHKNKYMAQLSGFQWCVQLMQKPSTRHSCQDCMVCTIRVQSKYTEQLSWFQWCFTYKVMHGAVVRICVVFTAYVWSKYIYKAQLWECHECICMCVCACACVCVCVCVCLCACVCVWSYTHIRLNITDLTTPPKKTHKKT